MKRYNMNAIGEAYPNALGLWSMYSDLQAWALRHKATVEKGMSHESSCLALFCSRCLTPVDKYTHWARDLDSMKHRFEPNECNCSRGDALREIEELLK